MNKKVKKPKNSIQQNIEGRRRVQNGAYTSAIDRKYADFLKAAVFPARGVIFECRDLSINFWFFLGKGEKRMIGIRFSDAYDACMFPQIKRVNPDKKGPKKYIVLN